MVKNIIKPLSLKKKSNFTLGDSKNRIDTIETNTQVSFTEKNTINEYLKLAAIIVEDKKVDKAEADKLLKWFSDNQLALKNAYLKRVLDTLARIYSDGVIDEQELDELFVVISESLDALDTNKAITYKDAKILEYSLNPESVKRHMVNGGNYLISYVDAAKKESDREIIYKALKTSANGDTYMTAICLLKNASRNFRLDRVRFIVDIETGKHVPTLRIN